MHIFLDLNENITNNTKEMYIKDMEKVNKNNFTEFLHGWKGYLPMKYLRKMFTEENGGGNTRF